MVILPSCPCCNCCKDGELPYTLTVKFSGLTNAHVVPDTLLGGFVCTNLEAINGKDVTLKALNPKPLVSILFEACFGGGASAYVVPYNDERVEPEITVSPVCNFVYWPSGSLRCKGVLDANDECIPCCGGTVESVTIEKVENDEEVGTHWKITAVQVSGGAGYKNNELMSVSACNGTVAAENAEVRQQADANGTLTGAIVVNGGKYYIPLEYDGTPQGIREVILTNGGSGYAKVGRKEPDLELSGDGDGATFSLTYTQHEDACEVPHWEIDEVTLGGDGSGYSDDQVLAVDLQGAVEIEAAEVRLYTREQPAVSVQGVDAPGSGASFNVTVQQATTQPPRSWEVASLAITNGGSGYLNGASITFGTDDFCATPASAIVTTDQNGSVIGYTITNPGSYWRNEGVPQDVKVVSKGKYYLEDKTLPPIVADITVTVINLPPGTGSGAQVSVTVNEDPYSPDFGEITGIEVTSEGSGYLIYGGSRSCAYTGGCLSKCGLGAPTVSVAILPKSSNAAESLKLQVALTGGGGQELYRSNEQVLDCDQALPPVTHYSGQQTDSSVTVSKGGVWKSAGGDLKCSWSCVCCLNVDTPYSFSSDCECLTTSPGGSGKLCWPQDNEKCEIKDGNGNPTLVGYPMFGIYCCTPTPDCTVVDKCDLQYALSFSSYLWDNNIDGQCYGFGFTPCLDFERDEHCKLTGQGSIPVQFSCWSLTTNQGSNGNCTVDVTLG